MKTMKTIITIIITVIFTSNINAQSKFSFTNESATNNIQFESKKDNQLRFELTATGPLIKWNTSKEINTSHFELQMSLDGTNFSCLRTVAAAEIINTVSTAVTGKTRHLLPAWLPAPILFRCRTFQ